MHTSFHQSLSLLTKLSQEEQEAVLAHLRPRIFRKGDLLGRQGEVSRSLFFVQQGITRIYHLDRKGGEHTITFTGSGQWAANLDSYLHQLPSALFIEAVTEVEVLELPYPIYAAQVRSLSALQELLFALLRESQAQIQRRLIDHLSKTAEELYWVFLEECPDLTQMLTAKQIASYLGVSNECISRIRRRSKD